MRKRSVKIDTVPLPEYPVPPITFRIPADLIREFEKEIRVVFRHPWIQGIPVPLVVLGKIAKDPAMYKRITKDFDIMMVPR
jgi:hypothetical protein